MTEIEIDKEFKKIPELRRGRKAIYPIDKLEVNQSFLVPLEGRDPAQLVISVQGSCRKTRFPDKTFIVRYQPEEEGVRCWRTE